MHVAGFIAVSSYCTVDMSDKTPASPSVTLDIQLILPSEMGWDAN